MVLQTYTKFCPAFDFGQVWFILRITLQEDQMNFYTHHLIPSIDSDETCSLNDTAITCVLVLPCLTFIIFNFFKPLM